MGLSLEWWMVFGIWVGLQSHSPCEVPLPQTVSSSWSVLPQAIVVKIPACISLGSGGWPSERDSFWRHKAVSIFSIWEYYLLWPSRWQYTHQLHVSSEWQGGTVVCFIGFTLLLVMAYTLFWEKELQSHWAYQMGLSGLLYLSGIYRNMVNEVGIIISYSMSVCNFASWHHLLSLVLPFRWCPRSFLILKLSPLCR
jgi:hypothetical protein